MKSQRAQRTKRKDGAGETTEGTEDTQRDTEIGNHKGHKEHKGKGKGKGRGGARGAAPLDPGKGKLPLHPRHVRRTCLTDNPKDFMPLVVLCAFVIARAAKTRGTSAACQRPPSGRRARDGQKGRVGREASQRSHLAPAHAALGPLGLLGQLGRAPAGRPKRFVSFVISVFRSPISPLVFRVNRSRGRGCGGRL